MKSTYSLLFGCLSLVLAGCGGGSDSNEVGSDSSLVRPDVPQVFERPIWWDVPLPDLAPDPSRPSISLVGPQYVSVNKGDTYIEEGATAFDIEDGDISANVTVDMSQLDTSQEGTYIVRYNVTDSDQKNAIEAVRFVRVDGDLTRFTAQRPIGTTLSHMGYVEYLPPALAQNPDGKFPLMIYIQGSGGNAESSGFDPAESLKRLIIVGGPPLLIDGGHWDPALPFIVLMPQFGGIEGVSAAEQIHSFIEYAVATYPVDEDRIYGTGWSQGAFLVLNYAINYPHRLAAMVSTGTGLSDINNAPDNACNLEDIPLWLFHGAVDDVIDVSYSINVYNLIQQQCQPRTAPRLTIYDRINHFSHEGTFSLAFLEGGIAGISSDPAYDPYDQSIFEWLLSHRLSDRQ